MLSNWKFYNISFLPKTIKLQSFEKNIFLIKICFLLLTVKLVIKSVPRSEQIICYDTFVLDDTTVLLTLQ